MIFDVLWEAAQRGLLILVDGGICRYGIRRDRFLVIYEIIVLPGVQGRGVGTAILAQLKGIEHIKGILAKCPARLAQANDWYATRGFKKIATEKTRRGGDVFVWLLAVEADDGRR